MGRKDGRGGRTDEESEKMKKLLKRMKNEKVAKGRIIGLAGPCSCINPTTINMAKAENRDFVSVYDTLSTNGTFGRPNGAEILWQPLLILKVLS